MRRRALVLTFFAVACGGPETVDETEARLDTLEIRYDFGNLEIADTQYSDRIVLRGNGGDWSGGDVCETPSLICADFVVRWIDDNGFPGALAPVVGEDVLIVCLSRAEVDALAVQSLERRRNVRGTVGPVIASWWDHDVPEHPTCEQMLQYVELAERRMSALQNSARVECPTVRAAGPFAPPKFLPQVVIDEIEVNAQAPSYEGDRIDIRISPVHGWESSAEAMSWFDHAMMIAYAASGGPTVDPAGNTPAHLSTDFAIGEAGHHLMVAMSGAVGPSHTRCGPRDPDRFTMTECMGPNGRIQRLPTALATHRASMEQVAETCARQTKFYEDLRSRPDVQAILSRRPPPGDPMLPWWLQFKEIMTRGRWSCSATVMAVNPANGEVCFEKTAFSGAGNRNLEIELRAIPGMSELIDHYKGLQPRNTSCGQRPFDCAEAAAFFRAIVDGGVTPAQLRGLNVYAIAMRRKTRKTVAPCERCAVMPRLIDGSWHQACGENPFFPRAPFPGQTPLLLPDVCSFWGIDAGICTKETMCNPGDHSRNGVVDQKDMDGVLLNWGRSTPWSQGPVDQGELDGVLQSFGEVCEYP